MYRVVSAKSGDYEEFFLIKGNRSAKDFACWHKNDVKKWADVLSKKCECR